MKMNSPRAQGIVGNLAEVGRIELGDVIIDSKNDLGAIIAISMTDKPIAKSEKILIQVCNEAWPTGWKAEKADFDTNAGRKGRDIKSLTLVGIHTRWIKPLPQ